jgi:hypothetical protein
MKQEKSMIRPLVVLVALAVAACASAPTYAPASSQTGAGYYERQIESNRYFVTYRASGNADAALLQDYALLRAADVTLEHGGSWFWVDRRALDEEGSYDSGPRFSVGVGGGGFGGRSGVGVGVGASFPLGGQPAQRAHSATIEMRIGEGPKPAEPNAYDAREISANLRSRLVQSR